MNKKIAIITGASNGIGKAVAIDLAKQHYHVVLIGRSEQRLKIVKDEIEQAQGNASYYVLDVANANAVHQCIDDVIKLFNRIDVLFNNAGILTLGTSTATPEQVDELIKINFLGAIYVANAVATYMKQQKSGYIINVASMAGKRALAANGIYSASKYGLIGYAEALFKELLSYGVKVTTICPSTVATDMTKGIKLSSDLMIQTHDIVNSVNYLLSLGKQSAIQELLLQCAEFTALETHAVTEKFF